MNHPEIPACAALRMPNGVIFASRRHDQAIKAAVELGISRDQIADSIQGFMTTHGRFVTREVARFLFEEAGLVSASPDGLRSRILTSEDLY